MVHSQGCYQEASISYHMGLSIRLFEYPHGMVANFPQNKWFKREDKEEAMMPFMT